MHLHFIGPLRKKHNIDEGVPIVISKRSGPAVVPSEIVEQ